MKVGRFVIDRGAVAWVLAGLLVGGCGSLDQARKGDADGADVTLSKDELCRVRPMKTRKRYVCLITAQCAKDGRDVGLRSSRSPQKLKDLGAKWKMEEDWVY